VRRERKSEITPALLSAIAWSCQQLLKEPLQCSSISHSQLKITTLLVTVNRLACLFFICILASGPALRKQKLPAMREDFARHLPGAFAGEGPWHKARSAC